MIGSMVGSGKSYAGAVASLDGLVQSQSVMQARLHVFGMIAAASVIAAMIIWIAPRPRGPIDTSGGH